MKAFLFYFLSFTWGIIMSIIGCFATLVLLIAGKKPKKYRCGWYFVVGKNWGGVNFGPCFVVGEMNTSSIPHEYGHAIQNCIFGPLFPLIVALPSLTRAGYRDTYFADKNDIVDVAIILPVFLGMFILIASMFHVAIWWLWIVLGVGIYITLLAIWLVYIEGSKYTNTHYPEYDNAWFEGWATRIGKYFSK